MPATASGSPAHAGIDPCQLTLRKFREGFPRTRGDRPMQRAGLEIEMLVPPHTRGIDPSATDMRRCNVGFPRTRGDRPRPLSCAGCLTRVPPHTRG